MLFAGIVLFAVGYTLVYAGVKGDHYRIIVGGKVIPVWQQPWLPMVAVFSRSPRLQFQEDTRADAAAYNTAGFYGQDPGGAQTAPAAPAPAAPAPAGPGTSGQLPPPGQGQVYG